jgi:hypothetical protein
MGPVNGRYFRVGSDAPTIENQKERFGRQNRVFAANLGHFRPLGQFFKINDNLALKMHPIKGGIQGRL